VRNGNDLFISAGAGTGKTHRISQIYVEILESSPGIDVENIVAITFTRKAAREMKNRIKKMMEDKIRSGRSSRWGRLFSSLAFAWITTIDAFARRILEESGLLVGYTPGLKIASVPNLRYILNKSVLYHLASDSSLLEPLLKLYTIDDLIFLLEDAILNRRYLLLNSTPIVSDLSKPLCEDGSVEDVLLKANQAFKKLFDRVYETFSGELRANELTDFYGVLLDLLDMLKKNQWIRERYAKKFRYIIVDEFQDTNSLQKEIIDLLRGPETSVIYVGDVKQSIYRFRGAEVEVMLKTGEEIDRKGGRKESLKRNYRSHPGLVRFTNILFSKVFSDEFSRLSGLRYEPLEPITLEGEQPDPRPVKMLLCDEREEEAVAKFVADIVGKEMVFLERQIVDGELRLVGKRRRVRYRDIAILLRRMRSSGGGGAAKITGALERWDIPYYVVGERGFYDIPEVAGVMAALRVIANTLDDMALVTLLGSPIVGLDLNDLIMIKHEASLKGCSMFEAMMNLTIPGARGKRLEKLKETLKKYLPLRVVMKPSELLEGFVNDMDYESFLSAFDLSGRKRANLRKLMAVAHSLDEVGISLRELVRRLERFGVIDEEQASTESEETDAVRIMSVHKAKGLEFPIVIVADTAWKKTHLDTRLLFTEEIPKRFTLLPGKEMVENGTIVKVETKGETTLLGELIETEKKKENEEEKRLLYVAITRAVDLLVITFPMIGSRGNTPWHTLLTKHLLILDDDVELLPDYRDVVDLLTTRDLDVRKDVEKIDQHPARAGKPDLRYMSKIESASYKEYIAPTLITMEGGKVVDVDKIELWEALDPRQLGVLAHHLMEAVGVEGMSLKSIGALGTPAHPSIVDRLRFTPGDLQEVWKYLKNLVDHPLIKEIENSHVVWNEYEITRPFDRYMLYGRVDKIVKTDNGWKFFDFKFATMDGDVEKYEFQMRFYLYIARDLFSPLLGGYIFFLKDGRYRWVELREDEIPGFEEELKRKIEEFHRTLIGE